MVEIKCPYCEQEFSRLDLKKADESTHPPDMVEVPISPNQWSDEDIDQFIEWAEKADFDAEPDEYTCGHPLSGDGDNYCTREVDGPGEKCWQHEDE